MKNLIREIREIRGKESDFRKFGFLIGGILVLWGGYWFFRAQEAGKWLFICGLFLVALGALRPRTLAQLYRIWMSLAVVLGFVMTRVILALVFYLVLTPIGLLGRLFGHKFLETDYDQGSYWHYRSEEELRPRYEEQY